MKKTVSFLVASFLITSAFAGEKMVVASAAPSSQAKSAVVVKSAKAKPVQKTAANDVGANYALESFGCCGLPQ